MRLPERCELLAIILSLVILKTIQELFATVEH